MVKDLNDYNLTMDIYLKLFHNITIIISKKQIFELDKQNQ